MSSRVTPETPRTDRENLQEVVGNQVALGHKFTLVPTDVLVRLLAAPPDSLDAAWTRVERALPEGWWLSNVDAQPGGWFAVAVSADGEEYEEGDGPTPAAALNALADRLAAKEKVTP